MRREQTTTNTRKSVMANISPGIRGFTCRIGHFCCDKLPERADASRRGVQAFTIRIVFKFYTKFIND